MQSDTSIEAKHHQNPDGENSLEHFAQVLAHRLRGLVAGIEGFTDLLTDTLSDPDQRELAFKIIEGASRIESVLADLQLYGTPPDPVMLPVRLDEVLRDVAVPLSDEERVRIQIDLDSEDSGSMLLADPFLLRQALLILIRNALDATKGGGAVRVEPRREDGSLCIHVWNEGMINVPGAAEVVFIPFFTTKAHNLGVGLSIARRIARLHDGTLVLSYNSRVLGTRFSFCIPDPLEDDIR